jgi:hypothetical protein
VQSLLSRERLHVGLMRRRVRFMQSIAAAELKRRSAGGDSNRFALDNFRLIPRIASAPRPSSGSHEQGSEALLHASKSALGRAVASKHCPSTFC